MLVFRAEAITKQFSEKFVLSNFSFEVAKGDKINIAGRSGIGKTTLFRLLLGFEKPDKGVIYFNEELLTEDKIWEVRRHVAYVSQDLSIGRGLVRSFFSETLSYKANLQHKLTSEKEILQQLTYFDLPETILDKNIEELSGGEKQRIAIVNALLLKRTIFLLDEVTSALDSALKTKVLDYFLSNAEFTVLYISHDTYLPDNIALRTLKLDENE
jgi:putative ABC transport system ATP-binding protein